MNSIKRTIVIFICFIAVFITNAQNTQIINSKEKPLPFFDAKGNIAIHTNELNALADTLAVINHRQDDIVWSKIVYRVVDMRDKQNNQLFFPLIPNGKYKSLLRVILESNATSGLNAYGCRSNDIQPDYSIPLPKDTISSLFVLNRWIEADKRVQTDSFIIRNPLTNNFEFSNEQYYEAFAKDQVKYLIQEVVFFNKHYSRMYTKIIGIAPIYFKTSYNLNMAGVGSQNKEGEGVWEAFRFSVLCWYLFDELRPFLAKQYVIPNGNETQRLTYDEFFAQRLYSTYLLGDENMVDKMLLQTYNDPESIRREQKRIETELLNVEQDLWEY
ncbi:MAG: gliding motility protein GldN [Bacteroidia bacterium]|nr:gliding motility protein GldN [Bacteroidia bacterium]